MSVRNQSKKSPNSPNHDFRQLLQLLQKCPHIVTVNRFFFGNIFSDFLKIKKYFASFFMFLSLYCIAGKSSWSKMNQNCLQKIKKQTSSKNSRIWNLSYRDWLRKHYDFSTKKSPIRADMVIIRQQALCWDHRQCIQRSVPPINYK